MVRRGRREPPNEVIVRYEGLRYRLDLERCHDRLARLIARGRFRRRSDLAVAAGVSRTTLWRFLEGRGISLRAAGKLVATLGLRFDEVAVLLSRDKST